MCGKSCYVRGFNLCYIRPDIHASHKKALSLTVLLSCCRATYFILSLITSHPRLGRSCKRSCNCVHFKQLAPALITPHTLKTGFTLLQMVNNEAFFDYSLISERYIFVPMPKLRMYIHITQHWLEVTVLWCTFSQLPPPDLLAVLSLILYGSSKHVYNSMKGRFTEVSFLWFWYLFVWGFFLARKLQMLCSKNEQISTTAKFAET